MRLKDCLGVVMRIKNEEYWIHYVVRNLLRSGLEVTVGDTGSTDKTVEILRSIDNPRLHLYDLGFLDVSQYGKAWQFLTEESHHEYVMAIGDEIMFPGGIGTVLNFDIGNNIGAFFDVQNVIWDGVQFRESTRWTKRKVYHRSLKWIRTILCETVEHTQEKERWAHIKPGICLGFHMRYCRRSTADFTTFGRARKFFSFGIPEFGEPVDLFGRIGAPMFHNPYWSTVVQNRFKELWARECKDQEFRKFLRTWRGHLADRKRKGLPI